MTVSSASTVSRSALCKAGRPMTSSISGQPASHWRQGLRIAWAVVPPRFLEAFLAARRWHRTVASLDQRALAELFDDGSFERHLRRCRALYRRRRDDVVAAVADLDLGLDVLGVAAGLHAVIALPPEGPDETSVRDGSGPPLVENRQARAQLEDTS